jgi:hypothetical protein
MKYRYAPALKEVMTDMALTFGAKGHRRRRFAYAARFMPAWCPAA